MSSFRFVHVVTLWSGRAKDLSDDLTYLIVAVPGRVINVIRRSRIVLIVEVLGTEAFQVIQERFLQGEYLQFFLTLSLSLSPSLSLSLSRAAKSSPLTLFSLLSLSSRKPPSCLEGLSCRIFFSHDFSTHASPWSDRSSSHHDLAALLLPPEFSEAQSWACPASGR